MMLHGLRRVGASVAVTTMLGAGVIATAGTANAAISDCPGNTVCVWVGANFTGTLEFTGNGTTMHNDPTHYYSSVDLESTSFGLSTDNTTLGRFCTYDIDGDLTNILNPKTSGNISNDDVYKVKAC
jgi:hypothetical protein